MVNVEVREVSEFKVCGKKCFISGQDNSQFKAFWDKMHQEGYVELLKSNSSDPHSNHTKSLIMGVSRVENDPENRAFDFYIASECDYIEGFESFTIPQCTWAIFRNIGDVKISALIDAEMYAFMEWLPNSQYKHAMAPEIEVYPYKDSNSVEFWLPIIEK